VVTYCNYVSTHWSVKESAVAYSAVAGVFAAVMLPFLGVVLSSNSQARDNPDDPGGLASIRMPSLILGAFLFCLTASFLYGVISGDTACIRANLVDGPAAFLFGLGAAMSFVALAWLAELWQAPDRTRQVFQDFAILGVLFIAAEVLFTIMQMLLSARGSTAYWPSIADTVLILAPPSIAGLATVVLYYLKVGLGAVGALLRWALPISYLGSVVIGAVFVNGEFSKPAGNALWVLGTTGYAWIFGITLASLVAFLPKRVAIAKPQIDANA